MEDQKVCGLCGQDVTDENMGTVINFRGNEITLCEDCNIAVLSVLTDDSPSEETKSAKEYLSKLVKENKTTPTGTLFLACDVLKQDIQQDDIPEELRDEVEAINSESKSSFATFLRILAWIVWIGGLIISITGANVVMPGRYSTYTEFSFGTFLTLLLSYLIYGIILMGVATVVDKVTDTNNKVNKLVEMHKK